MKFLPLAWAALWRNRAESVLTLLALTVGFALFGAMLAVNDAYERAIVGTRMDRLIVACAFDCGVIPVGYEEQLARIPHVTAVGGELGTGELAGYEHHPPIMVTLVDEGMRSAWPELPMSSAGWKALDINPTGIFLSRTAAARRNVRIGDTVTLNSGPGGTAGATSAAGVVLTNAMSSRRCAWRSISPSTRVRSAARSKGGLPTRLLLFTAFRQRRTRRPWPMRMSICARSVLASAQPAFS